MVYLRGDGLDARKPVIWSTALTTLHPEGGTNMRKSIIAGLTLCVALAFAEQTLAYDKGGTTRVNQSHKRYKHSNRVVETLTPQPQQPPTSFRIPANPVIRDCVHVMFPQCSREGGLNDGTYGLPY
jgi:hypothetical protein